MRPSGVRPSPSAALSLAATSRPSIYERTATVLCSIESPEEKGTWSLARNLNGGVAGCCAAWDRGPHACMRIHWFMDGTRQLPAHGGVSLEVFMDADGGLTRA